MDYRNKSKNDLINELNELHQKYDSLKELYDTSITGCKQAEEILHKNYFRKIVEQAPIAMSIVGMDGTIEFINNKAIEVFGYLPEDIPTIDKYWLQAYPDENYRKEVIAIWTEVVKRAINEQEEISGHEYRVTCKNGAVKTMFIFGVPVSGKIFILFEDITARKKAEEALHESEEKYRNIFENTAEGIFQVSPEGRLISANPALAHSLGYKSPEEIIDAITDIRHQVYINPNERDNLQDLLYRNGFVKDFIVQCRKKNGGSIWIELNTRLVKDKNGKVLYHEGTGHDITERKLTEEALKASEERYRHLVETTDTGYVIVDNKGVVIDANKEYARLSGHKKPDEIIGRNVLEWTADEEKEINASAVETCVKNGFIRNLEITYVDKTGKRTPIEINATLIEVEGKQRILTLCRDITERKQADEALRESEIRFHKIIEQAPIAMAIVSMEGVIEYINYKAIKVFGYLPKDIPNMDRWWVQAYPDENYRKEVVADWMGQVQNAVMKDKEIIGNEYRVTCKDGSIKTMFISGVPVSGKIFVLFDNITKFKKIEEELIKAKEKAEENEFKLLTFINSIPDIVCYKDGNGRWLFSNDANLELFSLTGVGYYGKTDAELADYTNEIYKEAFQTCIISDEKCWENKSITRVNEIVPTIGGEKKFFDVIKIPFFENDGKRKMLAVIARDITELQNTKEELIKAKEKAEESDRLKTAFLQNMSHEIRTPMNAIVGFSQLLIEQYNNKTKLEEYSSIINQRCNDLLEIINEILDISKIESGQLPVTNEECSLNELFSELNSFFKEYQKRNGKQQIKFNLQAICDASENTIITDKVKLKQIFINLIYNAFKFTDTGKIEGGCKFDADHNLIFYVSDTGIGIPPDKYGIIFERFAQLGHDKKQPSGGTGLGLSITKGLVNLLGGKIWLESELEKGTTFYFSFPYIISQSKPQESVLIVENQTYHFHGKTILIVEDDPYNAVYIKEILIDSGLEILLAEYGNEAVQIAASKSLDLVLMDIRLPDINGYEATRQIKKLKPNLRIIAQTAYATDEDRQEALNAGCIDYISKPLNRDLLLSMINKHLLKI